MSGHVLTREDVEVIHARLLRGERGAVIARDFAVSQQIVSSIRTGQNWSHVTGIRPGNPRPHTQRGPLSRDQVLEIDSRLRAGDEVAELARSYGVSYQTIYAIRLGTTWAWLTGRAVLKQKRKQ